MSGERIGRLVSLVFAAVAYPMIVGWWENFYRNPAGLEGPAYLWAGLALAVASGLSVAMMIWLSEGPP